MKNENQSVRRAVSYAADIDMGLRAYMLKVYNYMATGLAVTGAVALLMASSPELMQIVFGTPLKWVAIFAPMVVGVMFGMRIRTMSLAAAQGTFWLYAALMGVSLSILFMVFTGASIARVFFITAGTFGAMSLYGYTTQRDLSAFGSFLMMGVIGIVLASLVNIFMQSSALHFAISVIGVLVFTGLTAYDTQTIRQSYLEADDAELMGKKAVFGALQLYLDFVNLFVMLLQLMGNRRD